MVRVQELENYILYENFDFLLQMLSKRLNQADKNVHGQLENRLILRETISQQNLKQLGLDHAQKLLV